MRTGRQGQAAASRERVYRRRYSGLPGPEDLGRGKTFRGLSRTSGALSRGPRSVCGDVRSLPWALSAAMAFCLRKQGRVPKKQVEGI